MASESYVFEPSSSDKDEIDSLPSISSSALDSDVELDEAQEEWERSLEQLQMLMTMILIPFAGKYFGRKFAYWSEFSRPISLRAQGKTTFGWKQRYGTKSTDFFG